MGTTKEKKMQLIIDIQNDIGLVPYNVNLNSHESEIDDVLCSIHTALTISAEQYIPKIINALEYEKADND